MGDRWLGERHAIRVKKNPLHYTTRVELMRECIRCQRHLHYSAFQLVTLQQDGNRATTRICQECREDLVGRQDSPSR